MQRRFVAIGVVLALSGSCSKTEKSPEESPDRTETPEPTARSIDAASPVAAQVFPDLGAAVTAIVKDEKPRVIGFGEAHQLLGATQRSALARFTDSAMPALADAGSAHLILETWAERPECGKAQKAVDTQVRKDTERPTSTQSELEKLLAAAAKRGIGRHGMKMTCDEYRGLLDQDAGAVDYGKLLTLITRKLGELSTEAVRKTKSDALIFVYGGALHNDLYPNEGTAGWSYAVPLQKELADSSYVEVDIYVPEFIAADKVLAAEPWYALLEDPRLSRGVLLIKRAEHSYVILERRGVTEATPAH